MWTISVLIIMTDEEPVKLLRELGPSAIDTELRALSPDMGGEVRVMQSFLKMISSILQSKKDFDLAQAYLALFLKVRYEQSADIYLFIYICMQLHTFSYQLNTIALTFSSIEMLSFWPNLPWQNCQLLGFCFCFIDPCIHILNKDCEMQLFFVFLFLTLKIFCKYF